MESADTSAALDLADTAAVIDVIGRHDVTLIAAVSGRGGEMDQNMADHRALIEAAPVGRLVVVGGAGTVLGPLFGALVTVLLPDAESRLLTRELLYTGLTRAKKRVTIVGSEASIRGAVGRRTARASGLRHRL